MVIYIYMDSLNGGCTYLGPDAFNSFTSSFVVIVLGSVVEVHSFFSEVLAELLEFFPHTIKSKKALFIKVDP